MKTVVVKNLVDKLTYEFLVNDEFIQYVVDQNAAMNGKWNDFFSIHPEQLPFANKAKLILEGKLEPVIPDETEIFEMKRLIFKSCNLYNNN